MKKTIYSNEYDLFRQMIREERERQKLSQAELGRRLETHQPFVARIETGERRLDVVEFLHLMAAMGVPAAAFIKRLEKQIRIAAKSSK